MKKEKLTTSNQILIQSIIEKEFNENKGTYKDENSYFEFFSANQILKNLNLSDDQLTSGIVGGGNDGGCDAIYVLLDGEAITSDQLATLKVNKGSVLEIIIIQAKEQIGFGEDSILKLKSTSENLLEQNCSNESYKGRYNEDVLESFKLFRDMIMTFITSQIQISIKFFYSTLAVGDIHPNVIFQKDELINKVKEIYPTAKVEFVFVDADALMAFYNKDIDYVGILSLSENPISLGANDYITLINLSNYYHFITDENGYLRYSIFESNVRDYQGQNSVNSSIASTLSEQNSEADFWWLNNGVTIIAEELRPITTKSLEIRNPSVVNGLQTSREIYNYFSRDIGRLEKEKRNVLVRIICPKEESSRDKVIFATNNQTTIPKYSLRVTDKIHFQIEGYFKSKGLYYDRRKNYYKNRNKKRSDIIGVPFLAQCLITLVLKKPDYARARPSTLLTDDTTYHSLYEEAPNLESYFKVAKIGKIVKSNVTLSDNLERSEKSDILFYVIYAVVAKRLKTNDITLDILKDFDCETLSDDEINESKNLVYDLYKKEGGNSRVAKSSSFINKLIDELNL
ncbi:MAG: AIPR family protein [Paludibacteraceae bacterium]|nr:AIPR family protein [Paludibacteraceae bacterium]